MQYDNLGRESLSLHWNASLVTPSLLKPCVLVQFLFFYQNLAYNRSEDSIMATSNSNFLSRHITFAPNT